jgi:formylglycine-generating enzyme required for sulfatase activity
MKPVVVRATAAWIAALSITGSTTAQPSCAGVGVEVGGEHRCIKPGAGQSFKDCPHCPEMVVVPAGAFTMGAPQDEERHPGNNEHEDQVPIKIERPFAVGRFAVTRGEFAAFVAATDFRADGGCFVSTGLTSKRDPDASWHVPGFAQDDRHPVVCVSWEDAKSYVSWLSSSTSKGYRLLSESEREYVARAGTTTPFWWGTTVSTDQANYDGNVAYGPGGKTGHWRMATVPVDSFAANPWGLYNVHGNVWEWTEDCWTQANAGNPGDGRARLDGNCSLRVRRGASWSNYPHTIRAARRYMEPPGNRLNNIGFRVARTL